MAGIAWNWTEREMELGKKRMKMRQVNGGSLSPFTHFSLNSLFMTQTTKSILRRRSPFSIRLSNLLPMLCSLVPAFRIQDLFLLPQHCGLPFPYRDWNRDACMMMMIVEMDVMIYFGRVARSCTLFYPSLPFHSLNLNDPLHSTSKLNAKEPLHML